MRLSKQIKARQWENIIAERKRGSLILITDDTFECAECGREIDYDSYMDSDEEYCCPFCGEEILPVRL